MSLLANSNAIETGGYQISRSVRIRASATPYFNRTPSSTSGNNTWTFSCWVKRGSDIGSTSTQESIMGAGDGGGAPARYDVFGFYNDTIQFFTFNGSAASIYTTAVFRDPSAWYHLVCRYDDTQATASNRVRIYVNGVLQTLNSPTYPNQNYGSNFNTTYLQHIAANTIATNRGIDGYLAEVIMVSGQSLDPSSFGETDTITGVWVAKKYTGTYGTNGFYLNFSDNSAATSTTIGKDYSGNGNNWTPNNISVTAGSTYDSMLDVPSGNGYADGGNGRGNYATLNPLNKNSVITTSDGNLAFTASNDRFVTSTIAVNSGKWYLEFSPTGGSTGATGIGVIRASDNVFGTNTFGGSGTWAGVGYANNGQKSISGTLTSFGATYTTGSLIGVALDLDSGTQTITFYKNNVSQGTINLPVSSETWVVATNYSEAGTHTINFGQRPFTYTPPTGFVALNTYNLPASTIKNGAAYMAATTYTGTGASQTIANTVNSTSFQPDFVWMKGRSGATDHALYDSVRGTTIDLVSNSTAAETTQLTGLTAFGSTGFTIGALAKVNTNAATYIGWQWKAGGTSSSNTNGSITSTVSAGATQGFSVVTYTGTGANATVGHGLGVAPSMVIVKRRDAAANWEVRHTSIAVASSIQLNLTNAAASATTVWNSTSPSSTVFSIGTSATVNTSSGTYVAYCFAAVPGYSAFGSYTGNGSTDGPFVFCGFRPRYVFQKRTDTTGSWRVWDTSRSTYNVAAATLLTNSSSVELTTSNENFDILSNGFKLRSADSEQNTNGGTYIYAAFAENPFKYSNAR